VDTMVQAVYCCVSLLISERLWTRWFRLCIVAVISERLWTRWSRLCIVVYCCYQRDSGHDGPGCVLLCIVDIREIVDTMVQAVYCCCDIREIVDMMVQAVYCCVLLMLSER